MELRLEREPSVAGATIGKLFVDGLFECYTLEDQVRELRHDDGALVEVSAWKIDGKTAIPSGAYSIVIDLSDRFSKIASKKAGKPVEIYLPHLLNVPGFTGIRIHRGNIAADTNGCILLGRRRGVAAIYESGAAFDAFFPKLQAALDKKEQVRMTIENAPIVPSAA